jgi:hypothetical protein
MLADEVRDNPPRMFAIYGVYDHQVLEDDDPGYIEWGFEFSEESRAVTWSEGAMHRSGSAEEMLDVNLKLGAARLVWFS